jgi:hypothetical protein
MLSSLQTRTKYSRRCTSPHRRRPLAAPALHH